MKERLDSKTAHSVLHYLISRAVMEGKTTKTKLKLPLLDLQPEFEDGKHSLGKDHFDNTENIVLVVNLSTEWDTGTESDLETEDNDEVEF